MVNLINSSNQTSSRGVLSHFDFHSCFITQLTVQSHLHNMCSMSEEDLRVTDSQAFDYHGASEKLLVKSPIVKNSKVPNLHIYSDPSQYRLLIWKDA